MYLLQWFGPFRSVKELAEWEEQKEKKGKNSFCTSFKVRDKKKGKRGIIVE